MRMLRTLSSLLLFSLLISTSTALPAPDASLDRLFFITNFLCEQRIRAQCVTQCLSNIPTATCSGTCGGLAGLVSGTKSFTCSAIQPLATNTAAPTTTAAPAPDGDGPIRNDQIKVNIAPCKTVGGPAKGSSCVFPFKSRGVEFTKCTYAFYGSPPWCSTKVDANGDTVLGNWGECPTDNNKDCPLGPTDGSDAPATR